MSRTPSTRGGSVPGDGAWAAATGLVFAIALGVRLLPLVRGAGFGANLGYDAGVYYAAGDALTHARLPYRDFVLLHPPGIMLALAPFAVLGRVTSDHVGFIAANLAFTCIGAANAGLVVVVARRLAIGLGPALVGGAVAGLWVGSVRAEYLARLEPLGNLFVLLALLAWTRARGSASLRGSLLVGALVGCACTVKIWYVVPAVVIVASLGRADRDWRLIRAATVGAALAITISCGVFFAAAPGSMWRMVVAEQLGRNHSSTSPVSRYAQALDLGSWRAHAGAGLVVVAAIVFTAGVGLLTVAALRRPAGRVLVVLVVAQSLVLVAAPSWFSFYADFLTPALAVVTAVGADVVRTSSLAAVLALRRRSVVRLVWPAGVAAGIILLALPLAWLRVGTAFPHASLAAAASSSSCVMADSPTALIELDALSRSFGPRCRNWVDVTGRTYGVDSSNRARSTNDRWQRDVRDYLLSGDAFIFIRSETGLSTRTRAELEHQPVLARVGGYVIYRGRRTNR